MLYLRLFLLAYSYFSLSDIKPLVNVCEFTLNWPYYNFCIVLFLLRMLFKFFCTRNSRKVVDRDHFCSHVYIVGPKLSGFL